MKSSYTFWTTDDNFVRWQEIEPTEEELLYTVSGNPCVNSIVVTMAAINPFGAMIDVPFLYDVAGLVCWCLEYVEVPQENRDDNLIFSQACAMACSYSRLAVRHDWGIGM